MSFLQPLFLAGLALAGIPLILHLFTRQKYIEAPFPSLLFLEQSRRRSLRTISLHHLPALLARMLVVALLTLAFAAPLLKGRLWGAGEGRAPSEIFLIVDNSLSATWRRRGVSTYDRIREAAGQIVRSAAAEDTVHIAFLCGARAGEMLSSTSTPPAEMRRIVKESEAGLCGGDVGDAARDAARAVSASPAGTAEMKIVVLTDAQASAMNFRPLPKPARPTTVVLVDAAGGGERRNATIIPAGLPRQAIRGEPLSLCFDVRGEARAGAAVSLSIDGEPRGERSVAVAGAAGSGVCFHTTLSKTGAHYGAARLTPDALEADNARYFAIDISDAVEVAVVADREDVEDPARDAYYIVRSFRAAAAAGPGFQSVRATVTPAADMENMPFANFRVVVAPSGTPLTLEGLLRLADFARRGGGALIFADGDDPSAEAVAETLFDNKVVFSGASRAAAAGEFTRVESIDATHPAVSALPGVSRDLPEARFSKSAGVEVASGELTTIISLKNGRALLVERKIGRGRALLFASGVQPYRSSLSLQPVFLPAVLGFCRYLGGLGELPRREFTFARELALPFERDKASLKALMPAAGGGFELVRRGGRSFSTEDGRPLPPGVYEADGSADGVAPFLLAVNVDPGEGELKAISRKEFREKFPGFRHRVVGIRGGEWRERLEGEVFAREYTALVPIFLIAALGAVFLDVFLSNRR